MRTVVRRMLPSECPKCHTNTVMIVDKYGREINYPLMNKYFNKEKIKENLKGKDLNFMVCKKCRTDFALDWTKGELPYPIYKRIAYKDFEDRDL